MFFQFFFMGWKTDFTVLGFFFTVFSTSEENDEEMVFFTVFFTENTQFQLSLNKVPFSTCKKFPHEIIFPCLKCFLFVIHLHLSWTLASPRKLGQQRSTWGANGSLRKKHFTARKNDFILETLLPLRKVTFSRLEAPSHSSFFYIFNHSRLDPIGHAVLGVKIDEVESCQGTSVSRFCRVTPWPPALIIVKAKKRCRSLIRTRLTYCHTNAG